MFSNGCCLISIVTPELQNKFHIRQAIAEYMENNQWVFKKVKKGKENLDGYCSG